MKKAFKLFAIFMALSAISGCGDAPDVLIHDLLVFWNEACDYILRATDDNKAAALMNVQFKILKVKQEELKIRFEKEMTGIDKDKAKALDDAMLDAYDEIIATEKRMDHCLERLKKVIENASGDATNLKAIEKWQSEMKKFNEVNLGDYAPSERFARQPIHIALGLMPPRPQLDRQTK